ncbi:glycosyltransferase [Bacillus safensis]|uniref:glycosyltransferase n=1 Tax=Bacillus safensis TaxID=561879 RepID=UPI003F7CC1E6
MKKNICMYVWNHFTNDARVMRECTALSEKGYTVDLICIHDPSIKDLKRYEEMNDGFHVYRVKRFPQWLVLFQTIIKLLKSKKYLLFFIFLIWILSVYYQPLYTSIVTIFLILLLKTKIKTLIIRGSILCRMILKGFNNKYDFYHSNDLNTLLQGVICSKFRLNKKKLIYDSHEVQTSRTGYDSKFYGVMESFLLRFVDQMIVENHTRAEYNKNLYGFYPKVVHNYPFVQNKSLDQVNLHKILGISAKEKILLYQGGIQTGRGLENLVKAAPYFTEGILVFIGDGRIKNELIQLTEEMELSHKVKFLPKVPLADLPKYTKNAYLGFQVLNNVCFNHYSASSNKLFEYLMSGVPVVACNFPEIKKVVEGNKVGMCIDSHDHEDIAKAVNYMIEHPEKTAEFSKNASEASNQYNWENEKENFTRIYESLGGETA